MERQLLELGLYQMIYSDLSWGSMHSDIQNLNRQITNLLSSGRLYLDHIMHDVDALDTRKDTVVASLETKCSEQYDRRLGYRVMEALQTIPSIGVCRCINCPSQRRGNLRYVRIWSIGLYLVSRLRYCERMAISKHPLSENSMR